MQTQSAQGSSASPFKFSFSPSFSSKQQPVSSPITQQSFYYKQQINRAPLKDLHQLFPRFLSSIFGFDGSIGWQLKICHRTQHQAEYNAGYGFLCPTGDMFKLITKLDDGGFLYEFPIKCLPNPSQQALLEGVIPPFYQGKVRLSLGTNQETLDHVYLSAFEYYFFHFAYYVIYIQRNPSLSQVPWAPLQDCLYSCLLDSYLFYFLPPSGLIPNPGSMGIGISPRGFTKYHQSPSSPSSPGRPLQQQVQSPMSPSQSHTPLGLLKINGYGGSVTQIPASRGGVYASSATPLPQTDLGSVQTELFLQTLVEFWLNQVSHDLSHGSFLSHAQTGVSSQEHIRFIRMLTKHILYFSNGTSHLSTSSPSLSPFSVLTSVTDSLRNSVVTLFLQKKVYQFIRYAFQHWPLDENFRFVLELWLTYIQPWRYTDPMKPSSENRETFETLHTKWKRYVMENFPFYTSLFLAFLDRSFQLDFTSNIGVTFIFRVSKVFSQPGLCDYITTGEHVLNYDSSTGYTHHNLSPPSSPSDVSSLKSIFEQLEGPMVQYQPLFDPSTLEILQILLGNIQQAKSQLLAKSQSHTTSQSDSGTTTSGKWSWLTSLWHDLFNEEPEFYQQPQQVDPKKLLSSLESAENNLRTFFKLPGPSHLPPFTPADGSPLLHPPPSPSSSHLGGYAGHAYSATPPSSIEAEYEPGSCQLTPRGKEQVLTGIRMCSKSRIRILGDPMLQPIRTYENAILVRSLYKLSCYLNNKFSTQLATIGSSNRIIHKLLLQLLAPPPPGHAHPTPSTDIPSTPTSRLSRGTSPIQEEHPPRINLRVFGSYYTITYLFLLLLIIWLLSVPIIVVLLLLLFSVFTYCIIKYCIGSDKKNN